MGRGLATGEELLGEELLGEAFFLASISPEDCRYRCACGVLSLAFAYKLTCEFLILLFLGAFTFYYNEQVTYCFDEPVLSLVECKV